MGITSIVRGLVGGVVAPEVAISSDQNSPRPPLPYWTVKVLSIRSVGSDAYSQGVTNAGLQTVSGVREATVEVQRFGAGSHEACFEFANMLSARSVLDTWSAQDVVVYDVGDVANVPYKLDGSSLEPRGAVDVSIRFGTELLDNVGAIETVDIEAKYVTDQTLNMENTNEDLTETITVVI